MKHTIIGIAALAAIAVLPQGLSAQTTDEGLSKEETVERFKAQKTRGLALSVRPQESETSEAEAAPAATTVTAGQTQLIEVPRDEQVFVNITFDFDSAALRPDELPKLVLLCEAVVEAEVESLRIVGHTDSSGSADYNARLSLLRAEEVKRHLVTDCGIPAERLQAVGAGEEMPLDSANPRADVNRRVEFQVIS